MTNDQALKILTIGVSGFLSGALVRRAVRLGHHVSGIPRGNGEVPEGAHAITLDRSDRAGMAEQISRQDRGWDVVVDLILYFAGDAIQEWSCL